ncbi:beta-1,6-N-acetylglucosaminyltransferase enzyme, partial [Helicosporidium sp. ATCC 50920]
EDSGAAIEGLDYKPMRSLFASEDFVPDFSSPPPLLAVGGRLLPIPSSEEQRSNLTAALQRDDYNEGVWARFWAPESAMGRLNSSGPIARQDLFSVHVHTTPSFAFPPSSIFSGYEVDRRVYAHWGQFSIAEAERRLMHAALRDPRVQRVVLLSESCAPVVPAHALHAQLLWEARSRVHTCVPPDGVPRWRPYYRVNGVLEPRAWRKSSQWVSLSREHAEMVAGDSAMWRVFEKQCYSLVPGSRVKMPPYLAAQGRRWSESRDCVSDEHYVPTLLVAGGAGAETDCDAVLTSARWEKGKWSPHEFGAGEVSADLLWQVRQHHDPAHAPCDWRPALESLKPLWRLRGGGEGEARRAKLGPDEESTPFGVGDARYRGMSAGCPLFARKFEPEAAAALVKVGRDCMGGSAMDAACMPGFAAA